VAKDNWAKHKETTTSYTDLRATMEGYYEEIVDHIYQTNKLVNETMNHLDKTSQEGVDKRAKLLKTLNKVSETLKAYSNNTTSGYITSLTELLKIAQLLEILTQLNSFQTSLNTLNSQCESISDSLK
ncbi:hypothetical protein Tco_0391380, partial [Tanacetum coccineum]